MILKARLQKLKVRNNNKVLMIKINKMARTQRKKPVQALQKGKQQMIQAIHRKLHKTPLQMNQRSNLQNLR